MGKWVEATTVLTFVHMPIAVSRMLVASLGCVIISDASSDFTSAIITLNRNVRIRQASESGTQLVSIYYKRYAITTICPGLRGVNQV